MRSLVAVTVLASSGCSWVFMQKPETDYAVDTQPQCSESRGWPTLDLVFATLGGVGAMAALAKGETEGIVGGGLDLLVFGTSAITGFGWAGKCETAKRDYATGGDVVAGNVMRPGDEERRQRLARQLGVQWCVSGECFADRSACARHAGMTASSGGCEERREGAETKPAEPEPKAVAPEPRGFFCSASPATGFCVRNKAECVRTRDVSIAALPDLGECTLTEAAWCTGDLCFPRQELCGARVASAGSGAGCERRE